MPMRFLYFILFLYCLPIKAQQLDEKNKIIAQFDSVRNVAPREKLYVHFDKSTYTLTDTIWFKGYLVGASLNSFSSYSGLVYTELINADGEVVQRMSLPTAMGLTWGAFAINPDKYQPGTYMFRAYTNWMQNFGSTYLFKKELQILSLTGSTTSNTVSSGKAINTKRADTSLKQKLQDIDVQFLPEGGKWIAGVPQRMAFKAINANGKGIIVKGEVIDSKQNKIVEFESGSLGMGYFNLLPEADQNYVARVKYGNVTKNINLPKLQQNGIILQVNNNFNRDSIKITSYSTLASTPELTMLGQARGIICFIAKIKFNSKSKTVNIAKSIFPTGVCQILLLDEQQKTINERNFFIDHKDELKLTLNNLDTAYRTRDSIPVQLNVLDFEGKPTEGSFSIVVTDDNQVAKDAINDENILSYFLLSSDLKGEIENPGYYFSQTNIQKHTELDALMLTQGWVSYNWDLSKKPLYKMEKEYRINGVVTNVLNKPAAKSKITLLGRNRGFLMLDTIANDKGEFTFNQLPLMDSASFVIQALNAKGKKGTLGIVVDEFKAPLISLPTKNIALLENEQDTTIKNLISTKKQELILTAKDGILLNEVKIVGKRVIRGSKNLNGPGEADQTLTEEDLNKVAKKTLLNLLEEKVKGFRPGFRRKSNTKDFFINAEPLRFVIDGTELDFFYYPNESAPMNDYYEYIKGYLDYYSAEDIRGIEVMANFGKSMRYKSQFMDPLDQTQYAFIEITTRTGSGPFLKKSANMYLYRPINYGDAKIFYSPKYTPANKSAKKPDFRSTIYWNPNLMTDANGKAQTSFFSADKKGTYTVWIEGSDMQGNFGMKTLKLNIK